MITTARLSASPYANASGSSNDLSDSFGAIPETDPETLQAARLAVAAHALDAEDARELLAMLGLSATYIAERE